MEDFVQAYLARVSTLIDHIAQHSAEAIHQAASAVAKSIQQDGVFMLFGSGHSALIAKDAAYRAGGLAGVLAIEDIIDGDTERIEGVAPFILARYDLRPNNVIAIISNSGINPVPIEMAMICKSIGMTVIVISSLAHSRTVNSRHSSGKRLYEVADIVIDTQGVLGDAAIELPGSSVVVGAMSTIAGSAIVQSITVQAAALLAKQGGDPLVWVSANVPTGDASNERLVERYRPLLGRYPVPILPPTNPSETKS